MKKYKITRATIRFPDGSKDILHGTINTNDLEAERKRLKTEFEAKTIEFRFFEIGDKMKNTVRHGSQ